jgi:hydroxymethylpyrimidine pyrophosphatase-like HAD family hydrolase
VSGNRQDGGVWTPRLIASDVDGTLLDPNETVTPRTVAAVAAVRAAGIPFVLVTGRPPGWIPWVAKATGLTGYAVCSNGAVLYDLGADRVIAARALGPELLSSVVHTLSAALPDVTVAVQRVAVGVGGVDGHDFVTEEGYQHPWPNDLSRAEARAELLGVPAVSLLVRRIGVRSEQLAEAAVGLLGDAVHITFSSGAGILEITAPGVSKGAGLAEVADRLGVAAADVVAFGDMPNDLAMLRWAGLGVAMGNAHPDVLAIADEVTLSNAKDGVAVVLERWFAA